LHVYKTAQKHGGRHLYRLICISVHKHTYIHHVTVIYK